MQFEKSIVPEAVVSLNVAAKLPAILALLFGVFLIFGAAFAQPSNLHNAAHDTRHSIAAPCH